MTAVLPQVLRAEVLEDILQEGRPVEEVVDLLFQKGCELAEAVSSHQYGSWRDFTRDQATSGSPLAQLEGASRIDDQDVDVLLSCPMAEQMKKLHVEGKPPAFHQRIVDSYKAQNPGSDAILHPGCIAHQVARQLIVKQLSVAGVEDVNFYQLACRSAAGKVVHDENGLAEAGMDRQTADRLIEGQACLYVLIKKPATEAVAASAGGTP